MFRPEIHLHCCLADAIVLVVLGDVKDVFGQARLARRPRHVRAECGGEVVEVEQYYHRYVVAMLIDERFDMALDIEPLLPADPVSPCLSPTSARTLVLCPSAGSPCVRERVARRSFLSGSRTETTMLLLRRILPA